jgi:Fungal chitosanase of glycosyl hydrolase group 75
VGSVASGTTSFALCNNPGIGRTVSSLAGTPVILTDHKRPLMLGVYGAYDSNAGALKFTSVMETMPGTALPIADSFAEFFKNEMHKFWQPLRPRSASARGPIYVPASEEKIATFTKNLEAACRFRPWERFRGTDVFSDDAGTYVFRIDGSVKDGYTQQVSIDADGAPNAYHPADTGLDKLAHAGYPLGGWKNVLVADPSRPSVPYVQTTGKFAGYFVSQTGLRDDTKKDTDPSKYVNSDTVPYIALPTQWYKKEGTGFLGDVVIVKSMLTGATSSAVIADTGGTAQTTLGEMSLELARRLGAKGASAISGPGVPMDVMVMVFRGSRFEPAWPVVPQDIDKAAVSSLKAAGGWPAPSCLTPSRP